MRIDITKPVAIRHTPTVQFEGPFITDENGTICAAFQGVFSYWMADGSYQSGVRALDLIPLQTKPKWRSISTFFGMDRYAVIMIEKAAGDELAAALLALLIRDTQNTCPHENTHRAGAQWEICDDCGTRWADDMGGKPAWEDPQEWVAARAAIANWAAL